MTSYLLRNATVITMDAERRVLENGSVYFENDRIVGVGRSDEFSDAHCDTVIDCTGSVVMPGLIDVHGHAGHSLIKTLASDTPSLWMRVVTPTYYHYTTPEYWLADGYVSALDRLRMGVTCGASVMSSAPRSDDPTFATNHARAYAEVGVRGLICTGTSGMPWPHPVTRWRNNKPERHHVSLDEMIENTFATLEECSSQGGGLITGFVTPFTIVPSVDPSNPSTPDRATRLTSEDRVHGRKIKELAEQLGVRIHSDAFAGMVRMAWQDPETAILGPNVHLQHCIGLSAEEVRILAETGTHVSHAPGGGAPILQMMSQGINVAITTDGTAPQANFDLLQSARLVQLAHRTKERDDYLLPPGKLLEMITIDAARAVGLDHEIGSLEVGKKADIVILDMRQPHLTPNWMPVHRVVLQAVGRDVETVFVDGKLVLQEGKVVSIDMRAALEEGESQARALVKRAGLESHLTSPGWGMVQRSFDAPILLPEIPVLP